MLLWFFSLLFMVVFCLLGIAFFTLFERNVLSVCQSRLGPNKAGYLGFLQPLLDGLKLFLNQMVSPTQVSVLLFFLSPLFFFFIILNLWFTINFTLGCSFSNLGGFLVLVLLGLSVYSTLVTGLSSFSNFGVLGGMRSAAQSVSYEISFSILLFIFLGFLYSGGVSPFGLLIPSLLITPVWFFCLVAEVNRSPVDFAEGESELISGFNLEYSGGAFVFLFLGEYGFILVLCYLSSCLFCPDILLSPFLIFFFILLLRCSLPRFRYDILIGLCWLFIFPFSVCLLFLLSAFFF